MPPDSNRLRLDLDGDWECAFVEGSRAIRPTPGAPQMPDAFDLRIRVPFSPEAPASGVGRTLGPGELLWYRRSFEAPDLVAGERLILHFGAVDWRCWCFVDGRFAGEHRGGYEPFSFDITGLLDGAGANAEVQAVAGLAQAVGGQQVKSVGDSASGAGFHQAMDDLQTRAAGDSAAPGMGTVQAADDQQVKGFGDAAAGAGFHQAMDDLQTRAAGNAAAPGVGTVQAVGDQQVKSVWDAASGTGTAQSASSQRDVVAERLLERPEPHLPHGEQARGSGDAAASGTGTDGPADVPVVLSGLIAPPVSATTGPLADGTHVITLCVEDPQDAGLQPRGKQHLDAHGIWYPAQSGIWQSVWAEVVPAVRLTEVSLLPDAQGGTLRIEAHVSRPGRMLRVIMRESGVATIPQSSKAKGAVVASSSFAVTSPIIICRLPVEKARLWSPDEPFCYDVELRYGTDVVTRTCAWRTVGVEVDESGIPRFCLNHEPLMLRGVLFQGYWEGSLMTPPSAEALERDLLTVRDLGFNLVRVHAKVECERFYELCDRLGILVCQDLVPGAARIRMKVVGELPANQPWTRRFMPDGGPLAHIAQFALGSHDPRAQALWIEEALSTVRLLRTHPCIVMWCAFNEGWGQFDAARLVRMLATIDPTRPIDATSGWFDQRVGDFESVHDYTAGLGELMDRVVARRTARRPRPRLRPQLLARLEQTLCRRWARDDDRALLLSECGGIVLRIEGHSPAGELYGYGSSTDPDAFARMVASLRARLEGLWDEGLAGYIYTQLSDVEQECNGLVTYDRAVRKV